MDNYNKSMNFLVLGSDQLDKEHPLLKNSYLRFNPDSGISPADWEIMALSYRFSDEGMKVMEDLRCFYLDKVKALKVCFDAHLSGYGSMEIPPGGLSVWLEFHEHREIADSLEMLRALGVYTEERNSYFNPGLPVDGINIGFGSPGLEVWNQVFRELAIYFKEP